jgi:predicted lipid-binding transport protein (Tim44 family)
MKTLSLLAIVLTLGLTLATGDAEAARRLGAGKSSGMQRQMTTPPAATPAQAPASAASSAKAPAPAAAAAPQAQPRSSWMGPLAGLAAGLGLAALASHFGFGEGLANMLMIGLLVMAVLAVVGFVMRRRAAAQQPAVAYSGAGPDAAARRSFDVAMPGSAAVPATAPAASGNIPADFDVEGFVRSAKVNYIRLQAANDAGNLDDIKAFTTPEMFAELKMDITERGAIPQETDVLAIDAQVLEVVEEGNRYVVSVRFTGSIREERNGADEAVDEVWHLVKPREGGGWLLAGIQQLQ